MNKEYYLALETLNECCYYYDTIIEVTNTINEQLNTYKKYAKSTRYMITMINSLTSIIEYITEYQALYEYECTTLTLDGMHEFVSKALKIKYKNNCLSTQAVI